MGILKALFTSKSRSIREYRFVDITEDAVSPHMAMKFKDFLDSTKSFGWDCDDLYWHIYDESSGITEKSRIAFNAKFVKEDGAGNKVYIDSGKTETGEGIVFYFVVAPSNSAIHLHVKGDDDYAFFSVFIILRK